MSDRFEVPPGGPYLLAHSVGCLPTAARGELETALFTPWAAKGGEAWPLWLSAIDDFRAGLAALLGGKAADYCPQPNVSAALFSLLSGMPRRPGRDALLLSDQTFPTLGFVMGQFERLGFKVRWLDGDPADAEVWENALTDDVAAVLVMHVHSNTSVVSPIADICAAARRRDVLSIIDVAQSAGILAIDIPGWHADAVIGSCVKWLCGGPGAGWLWADPDRTADFAPLNVGWFSHTDPFAFDIHDFRYAGDARKFWGGTPSVAPFVLATAGIRLVAEAGIAGILRHNRRLIARAAPQADMTGRGGTLCATPRDIDAVMQRLTHAGCRFDRRGDRLRLSFHLWNTDAEADLVASCLE
jgi:selenocysteine lyase/cysteine desulfurase